MVQVLCRRRKNNPLLVGEPGVGKTALAEGLALRIHQGEVPEVLKGARVFALDLGCAGRRHAVSRRLRGARQAGARSALEGGERDPLHRRDPHAGRRRCGVRRRDGCREPAEAGARQRAAAMHRLDDVQRREAVVRSRSRAVPALSEDRRARAVRRRSTRDSQGAAAPLRITSRRAVQRRGAGRRGGVVGSSPAGPASARQGDRRPGRGRRGAEAAAGRREDGPHRCRADRADRGEDGARAGADGVERRQARARASRRRVEAGDLRAGRPDRRGGVGHQVVALRACVRRTSRSATSCSPGRPASARRSSHGSSPASWGSSSSASTCPSTWRSTPCRDSSARLPATWATRKADCSSTRFARRRTPSCCSTRSRRPIRTCSASCSR